MNMTENEKNIIEKLAGEKTAMPYKNVPGNPNRKDFVTSTGKKTSLSTFPGDKRMKPDANKRLFPKGRVETPATKTEGGERTAADMGALIQDLIEGAQKNSNLAGIELDGALAQAGFTPLDVAKTAGVLVALGEAEFTVKEACEATGLDETTLQAIAVVAQ
jgi:hypothetical protein